MRLAPSLRSTFPPLCDVRRTWAAGPFSRRGLCSPSTSSICHAVSTHYVFSKILYLEYPGFKIHHHSIFQQARVGKCFLHWFIDILFSIIRLGSDWLFNSHHLQTNLRQRLSWLKSCWYFIWNNFKKRIISRVLSTYQNFWCIHPDFPLASTRERHFSPTVVIGSWIIWNG